MDIKETFLNLTKKTYPYGFEEDLIKFLPKDYYTDEHGNYFYKIGKSRTAFTCHLDTACKDQVDVVHIIDNNFIRTNGKSILGADDKAGVTILLYMIENKIPGLYCFFIGEEVGCIGSKLASKDKEFSNYDRMISFDRRGTSSVITHQSSTRCCSDAFAQELSKEFNLYGMNMTSDDTGVYTDSAEFISVIPECTNISVGYYQEHTYNENQNISHLIKLCLSTIYVKWESLPTKRDPKKIEYLRSNIRRLDYGYGYGTRSNNDYDRENYLYQSLSKWDIKDKKRRNKKRRVYLDDIDNDITDDYDKNINSKMYYEPLKQIIFDDRITSRELQIIKEQCLDMDNDYDKTFYNTMHKILNPCK